MSCLPLDVSGAAEAESLQKANSRLSLLNEILAGLGGVESREAAAAAVIERLADALDDIRVGFSTLADDGTVEVALRAGLGSRTPGAGSAALVSVADYLAALGRQEVVTVRDVHSEPRLAECAAALESDGVRALLAVGFPRSAEATDALWFESAAPRAWSEEDAALLVEVAAYLFLALQDAAYREERERAFSVQARTAARLTTLVESVQVGVLEEDEERRITLVNRAFCEIFHLPPPEELIGKPTRETLRSTRALLVDPEGFLSEVDDLIHGRARQLDREVTLVDGRILERDYLPNLGRDGYLGHFWVFRDITAHKRTAAELRRSAERYRDFVENGVAMAWSHDLEGRVVSSNRSLALAVGASAPDELVGQSIPRFLEPGFGPTWEEYLGELLGRGVARGRFAIRCFDGETRIFAFSNVLRRDEAGEAVVRGFGENVTDHALAERTLHRRMELKRQLVNISALLMSSTTEALDEAIGQAIGDLRESLRVDGAIVFLLDGSAGLFRPRYGELSDGVERAEVWPEPLPVAELPHVMVELLRFEPFRMSRLEDLPAGAPERALLGGYRLRSLLGVPISSRGRLLGFVGLAGVLEERSWPEDEVAIVRVIGDILGGALERKSTEDELSAANLALAAANRVLEDTQRRMALLNEMGELLLTAREVSEARSVLQAFLPRMFEGCSGSALVVGTHADAPLEPVVAWGPVAPRSTPLAVEECWALRRSRIHVADREGQGPACPHVEESGVAAELRSFCLPLQANGNLLGLLHLCEGRFQEAGGGAIRIADLRQVAINSAEQISLGLWNLQLRESLLNQALEDPLTGLRNRRYLEERLSDEIRRAARGDAPLAVMMIDLDHFKRVNDLLGHPAGDRMLIRIARFLEEGVRREDVVARYGGEEFTVVLPGVQAADARWVAEKLRKGARRLASELGRDGGDAAITLSIGVAVFPAAGATVNELLEAADGALYQAKREGRDRVVLADPEPVATIARGAG